MSYRGKAGPRRGAALVAAAAMVLAGCGPQADDGPDGTAPSSPGRVAGSVGGPPVTIGAPRVSGNFTARVISARWDAEPLAPEDIAYGEPKNGTFLIVDAQVVAINDETSSVDSPVSYSDFDWVFVDAAGRRHSTAMTEVPPGFGVGSLVPGRKVRGYLVFDAPRGPGELRMGPSVRIDENDPDQQVWPITADSTAVSSAAPLTR